MKGVIPMSLKSIWSTLEISSEILGDYAYPAMDKAAANLGLEPGWFSWVAAIYLFAPHPFTLAQFMRVFPYGLAQVTEARFAAAIRQGYLTAQGQGEYCATALGENVAISRVFQAANRAIAPRHRRLHLMPDEALQRLVHLLARLVGAAFATPEPPSPFIMAHKRAAYERAGMRDALEGFVARCLELEGYRDDAYITTWQAKQIEGHAWEAFDQLARDGALTFDDLHARVSGRGVPPDLHAEDVLVLIGRGWVKESAGVLHITPAGKQVRAEVETETERLFFAPWSCLNESELDELANLATQLRGRLQSV